jgi:hypothetical protein
MTKMTLIGAVLFGLSLGGMIEGIAALSIAALLYVGSLFVFCVAVRAAVQSGYGWGFLALLGAICVVGWAIKGVQHFWPALTASGGVGALRQRAIALVPKRTVLVVTGAGMIVLGLVVPPLAVGILALAAADCFKAKDFRNGCEAVFCALMLFVFSH